MGANNCPICGKEAEIQVLLHSGWLVGVGCNDCRLFIDAESDDRDEWVKDQLKEIVLNKWNSLCGQSQLTEAEEENARLRWELALWKQEAEIQDDLKSAANQRIEELEAYNEWLIHNGGLLNEFGKEWNPEIHKETCIDYVKRRIKDEHAHLIPGGEDGDT